MYIVSKKEKSLPKSYEQGSGYANELKGHAVMLRSCFGMSIPHVENCLNILMCNDALQYKLLYWLYLSLYAGAYWETFQKNELVLQSYLIRDKAINKIPEMTRLFPPDCR